MLRFNPLSGTLDIPSDSTALDAHANNTSNPHNVTKAQVGLGNANNTSDADKPVSTAQQAALNAKANAADTVNLTGNQTVAGVKTFSSAPIAPSGTSIGGVLYLTGTGMPNGVVSASVGSIYIDKDITNGASSWIKKSGTGSTGWQVLEGDTGWRNVLADALTGWKNTSTVAIRRTGSTVTIQGIMRFDSATGVAGVKTSIRDFYVVPTGFRNAAYRYFNSAQITSIPAFINASNSSHKLGAFAAWGITAGSWENNDAVPFTLTWSTIEAWPTTLPGTAL